MKDCFPNIIYGSVGERKNKAKTKRRYCTPYKDRTEFERVGGAESFIDKKSRVQIPEKVLYNW